MDLPVGDVERHHVDQPALGVERQRAGLPVDLDPPERGAGRPGRRGAPTPPACARRGRGRGAGGPGPGPCRRRRRAAPTSWASSSSSAARSPSWAAAKKRRASSSRSLARGLEARPALVDVTPGPRRELAGVVLALAEDRGDLVVAVVEDVAEQERRALLGRQALEQHEEGERQRVGHLRPARRIVGRVVGDRSARAATRRRSVSRRARAERSSSMARRVAIVATYARGDSIRSPCSSARCTRSSASCTTSSASATLPSIR